MEYRIVLTEKEAFILAQKLAFLEVGFVKDVYTGDKRIRTDSGGTLEKEYKTPSKGIVYRFSARCRLDRINNVWFEYKWTENKARFEVEFEEDIPEEFQNRENISGWDILK